MAQAVPRLPRDHGHLAALDGSYGYLRHFGSRRYADPAAYLLTADQWSLQRAQFCQLVGKLANPAPALAAAKEELADAHGELEQVLAAGDGSVRLDENGDLVISPLTAEDVPTEAVALKAELTEMLPFAPIVSLLIELGGRTGFWTASPTPGESRPAPPR